ncbi:MAG TPA: OB-fold domain-containing protein [Candidatus Binatia bacterium]|nr:OB-fold domain-containing protein [Candidatus Binatia bacterium]
MSYFRAVDPFPLQSPEDTRLADFYRHLGAGRLTTTCCEGCGRVAWPPRLFCPACRDDRVKWVDLPGEGSVHAFTVQETGLPVGFEGPRVFAVVAVGDHRIFTIVTGVDPARVQVGDRVRFTPLRVADDPRGQPRWLVAFTAAP